MNISEISIGTIIADKSITFVILDTRLSLDGTILECIALTTDKDLISYTIHCDDEGTIDNTSYVVIVDDIMSVYGNLRRTLNRKEISKLGDITI